MIPEHEAEVIFKSRRNLQNTVDFLMYYQISDNPVEIYISFDFFQVEHIVREDYLVEGYELIESYCDFLLARFGLIKSMT
jgi:hypothetical protein